jgi:hypothetical protein
MRKDGQEAKGRLRRGEPPSIASGDGVRAEEIPAMSNQKMENSRISISYLIVYLDSCFLVCAGGTPGILRLWRVPSAKYPVA